MSIDEFNRLPYPHARTAYLAMFGVLIDEVILSDKVRFRKTFACDDFIVDVNININNLTIADVYAMTLDDFLTTISIEELVNG